MRLRDWMNSKEIRSRFAITPRAAAARPSGEGGRAAHRACMSVCARQRPCVGLHTTMMIVAAPWVIGSKVP